MYIQTSLIKHDAFYESYHNYRIFMQPKYLKNHLFLFKEYNKSKIQPCVSKILCKIIPNLNIKCKINTKTTFKFWKMK